MKKLLITACMAFSSVVIADEQPHLASAIVSDALTDTATQVGSLISSVVAEADKVAGEFIVAAPYIPQAIANKYHDANYEQNFRRYCEEPEKEIGKAIKNALQTEYTKMWCAETYGEYVNKWRSQ